MQTQAHIMSDSQTVNVTSEFGRLREAIVHRPGRELVRMTPSTLDYFLFDDLLYDVTAQREHDWLTDLLRRHLGIKLHYFDRMLADALASALDPDRHNLISQVSRLEADMPPAEQRIGQLEVMVRWFQGHGWPQYPHDPEGDPDAAAPGTLPGSLAALLRRERDVPAAVSANRSPDYLHYRLDQWNSSGDYFSLGCDLVEGIESRVAGASPSDRPGPHLPGNGNGPGSAPEDADALQRFAEGQLFYLTPLPNLMFLRDVGTVVNDRLLLSHMAAPSRAREALLLDFVLRNHPRLQNAPRWQWADIEPNEPGWPFATSPNLHLEGGSVLQLREDLIVLGVNQRTSMEAAQRIADTWREYAISQGKRIILYVLRMPAGFNHLDSVLGLISPDECIVYPPVFEPYGPASVDVVRAELDTLPVRPVRSSDFFRSLRDDEMDLTPIPCGGLDPVDQQREQWFSGTSVLALAPGKLLMYRSAERTQEELARHGYQIIDVNDVEGGAVKLDLDSPGKWALKVRGAELSRGHGGPHSYILPLVRDRA